MKKRIFALALVIGVLLSLCASAWAANYYDVKQTQAEYSTIYKITSRKGLAFSIRVRTPVNSASDANGGSEGTKIRWTVSQDSANAISGDLAISVDSQDLEGKGVTAETAVSGTISGSIRGEVRVTATLYNGNTAATKNSSNEVSSFATIIFTPEDGTEARNPSFPPVSNDTIFTITDVFEVTEEMMSDPTSEFWDGLDPIYPTGGNNGPATAKGGGKPKLGKVDTKTPFSTGTPSTNSTWIDIPITGGSPTANVYVAAKDAEKLEWFKKGEGKNVSLDKASIAKYNIPFRIVSYDMKSTDVKAKGTAAAGATSHLYLKYNGANVEYKNFPLTIQLTNKVIGSGKPVTKTIKLSVAPDGDAKKFHTPTIYKVTYGDTLTATAKLNSGDVIGYAESTDTTLSTTIESADSTHGDLTTTIAGILSGDKYYITSKDADNNRMYYIASGDSATPVRYSYYDDEAEVAHDYVKSDKTWGTITVPLLVKAGTTAVELESEDMIFYASTDIPGPYTINVKPAGKNGISVDIANTSFDYLGKVSLDEDGHPKAGYVKFYGKLSDLTKETKTPFTVTIQNPTTKKKTAAKITIVGAVPPRFDKSKWTTPADYDGEYLSKDKIMPSKRVEAGKLPSITFKVKYGTKPVSYDIDEDSDTTSVDLADVGLKFNAEKGKIEALTDKKSVKATVNETTDEFESIDLYVKAHNSAINILYDDDNDEYDAYDYPETTAMATGRVQIGITGAKAKFNTTDAGSIATNASAGTQLTAITMKNIDAGDVSNKVKFAVDAKSKTTLSELGLEIVDTWSTKYVSTDYSAVSGDKILSSGDAFVSTDVVITSVKSGDVSYTGSADIIQKADGHTYIIASKDYFVVYYQLTGQKAANPKRNTLIIDVGDTAKLAKAEAGKKSIKISTDNYGAYSSATVKITITAANSSTRNTATSKTSKVTKNGHGGAGSGAGTGAEGYESDAESEAEDENESEAEVEAVVTRVPRTAADLTAAQQAFLAANGYKVIAVLPELTANVDGQQDIEVVLDEDAPEGEKMIYIPFPKDVPEVEDDSIVDFYDAAGAPIEEVPAEKAIVAAPWLRADVVYEPVIAVQE